VFSPEAVVDHVGAPHVRGRRFDFRYMFWARRNHALLLARNFGLGSPQFRSWVVRELGRTAATSNANSLRRAARIAIGVAGIGAGLAVSVAKGRWGPTSPVRRDRIGDQIRVSLAGGESLGAT
jgi:hypothetical protein